MMQICFSHRWKDLKSVAKTVQLCYTTRGFLGATLFRKQRHSLATTASENDVGMQLCEVQTATFSLESIHLFKEHCDSKQKTFKKAGVTECRTVGIEMCQMTGEMLVGCVQQEREVQLTVLARTISLGKNNGLPLLPREVVLREDLVQDGPETCEVPFSVITDIVKFREMLLAEFKKKRRLAELTTRGFWKVHCSLSMRLCGTKSWVRSATDVGDKKNCR